MLSTFTTTVRSEVDLNLDRASYEAAKAAFDARACARWPRPLARYETEQLPGQARRVAGRSRNDRRAAGVSRRELRGRAADPGRSSNSRVEGATAPRFDAAGRWLAAGRRQERRHRHVHVRRAHAPVPAITGLRLEALADDSLAKRGPGRAENGNFALSDIRVTAAPVGRESEAAPVKLAAARATFEQAGCRWPRRSTTTRNRPGPSTAVRQGPCGRVRVRRAGRHSRRAPS